MKPATVRLRAGTLAAAALATVSVLAAACAVPARPVAPGGPAAPSPPSGPAPAVPAHAGVALRVLVLDDASDAVAAIRHELAGEGVPVTDVPLSKPGRPPVGAAFLTRPGPGGRPAGNFAGVVVPGPGSAGAGGPGGAGRLTGAEQAALAGYERQFGVRQVDAYAPPAPALGMGAPVFSGPLTGRAFVTPAGQRAGFGYLKPSFPFSGGAAGTAPFGYLARPAPAAGVTGVTPLVSAAIPKSSGSGTLVWQFTSHGAQRLAVSMASGMFAAQFRYLAHGIVTWLTKGVNLGYWRNYLTADYDDVINADAQWSPAAHCTPGGGVCPPGTKMTPPIRMTPADARFAVAWQRQHQFEMEFLYNGGSSARFQVNGTDPLLQAFQPVAREFYWINHTYTHANLGCQQTVSVMPRCIKRDGRYVWASQALISSQTQDNFTWAEQNGIPYVPGVLATGEYSGLRMPPLQSVDNPNLITAMAPNQIRWLAQDASVDYDMRHIGAALGVPRHPLDIGYDVDTVAEEISEYNWFHTSKKDGGSGLCEREKNTACIKPLNPKTGWRDYILPQAVQTAFLAMLDNDPRPFFMHQSNLTGDRLAYPVMDGALRAFRAVIGPSAPVVNLSMAGNGVRLREAQLWAAAVRAGTVTAWVNGTTVMISGPPGQLVPVTVPSATRSGGAGTVFGQAYGTGRSAYIKLGSRPATLTLPAAPFRQP